MNKSNSFVSFEAISARRVCVESMKSAAALTTHAKHKQHRSQAKILGGKYFDFKGETVFCLGYCLLKHKITRHARNLGDMVPLPR